MSRIVALVGLCIIAFAAATPGRNAYICEVLLTDFCNLADQTKCPADPTLTFGNTAYSLSHYNLVNFGNMYAPSGDVEGRAAIRGNVDLNAYSIGYQLRTAGVAANSPSYPYTMVVGGDAKWYGGSVHPDGTGIPYLGNKEYIFVGGDFSQASNYLQADRTGSCPSAGCMNNQFDAAQAYYKQLSSEFALLPSSASFNIQPWGTISITCPLMSTAQYVINMTPDQFSSINFWETNGCNPNSGLIVNIQGAGNSVRFWGNTQSFFANQKVLYNVVPQATGTPSVRVEVGVNGNLLAPDSVYNQPGMGVFIGQVIVADVTQVHQINLIFCAEPVVPNPPPSTNLCPGWETNCGGLDITLEGATYSFRDFNVISFNDFNADTGDVEGRLIVARDASLGAGYSVGHQLQTSTNQPDRHLPFSLVVGRDLTWISGALFPAGDGIPYPGAKENMYVGRNLATTDDLAARRTGGPGDISAEFTDSKTCYDSYSSAISAKPDNVNYNIEWSALNIDCGNPATTEYTISLTPNQMSQFTYTTVSNCNFQATWNINIRGTDDVVLTGGSFPAVPGGVVYNIIGSRDISVTGTEVHGSILAPNANLKQTGGVILGKVVAGNVEFALQVNRENTCPTPTTVIIPSIVTLPSVNSNQLNLVSNSFVAGENAKVAGTTVTIAAYLGTDSAGNYVYETTAPFNANTGDYAFVEASTDTSRTQTEGNATSSASVFSVAFALVAALIALAF